MRAVLRDYRAVGDEVMGRFTGGRDGTLWYYDTVANVLRRRWPSPLTADLQREVDELLTVTGWSAGSAP